MVKNSLHAQRKQLEEAALADAAQAADAAAQQQRSRLTRWALILMLSGIVMGAMTLTEDRRAVLWKNVESVKSRKSSSIRMKPFDMSQYDEIHLWHLRKAGGSTLRKFLIQVAEHHNLTFKVDEGMCYTGPPPRDNNNSNKRTSMVTMLKDPVARAVSAYWGEGEIDTAHPDTSFRTWALKTNNTAYKGLPGGHWFIWGCVQNCMTKIFGSMPVNLTRAQATLESDFDLIVQSNRLSDPVYQQWLSHIMGAPNAKILHENKSTRKDVKENQVAAPKEEDLEFLKDINQLDYQLLEYIVPKRKELQGTARNHIATVFMHACMFGGEGSKQQQDVDKLLRILGFLKTWTSDDNRLINLLFPSCKCKKQRIRKYISIRWNAGRFVCLFTRIQRCCETVTRLIDGWVRQS
ncbi:expressed unknown protein [Seminavis robusta]|uniref:Uncharacterized protein n=1 Tax=Seminavis robusta TaxID=568900 RepID=A0A9N8DKA6_9STRA|nr:expressed unknown protein [Seminavis robusta]|eukprot:Sro105_g053070.1 n/a (406) ;mRNA; f:10519-11736